MSQEQFITTVLRPSKKRPAAPPQVIPKIQKSRESVRLSKSSEQVVYEVDESDPEADSENEEKNAEIRRREKRAPPSSLPARMGGQGALEKVAISKGFKTGYLVQYGAFMSFCAGTLALVGSS